MMTQVKFRTFQSHLDEELKDPEFRELFENEKRALEVARQIVELRENLNLSQRELAERMGTSQQTISRLESGDYDGFTFKTLDKIARATGTILHIEFLQKAS